MMCSVCIGEVFIGLCCILTVALIILRFHLTLWRYISISVSVFIILNMGLKVQHRSVCFYAVFRSNY